MSGPRALWLTEEPPSRALGGGNIRQAHLFDALAQAAEIDLVVTAPVEDPAVRAAAANVVELTVRPPRKLRGAVGRRAQELALSLLSPHPLPLSAAAGARRALAPVIARADRPYDIVCIEHEALAPLWSPNRRARWVLTFHNLLSGMAEEEISLAPGRRQRWFRRRELAKAEQLERRALSRFDRCIVCSTEDAVRLGRLAGAGAERRLSVVPNGVDLDRFPLAPPPSEPHVLLPGTLDWPPNVDGATWFCSEVWGRVRAAVPGACLVLAGRSPAPPVRELASVAGVRVDADVPSMVPYFASARTVVVPLRIGTGTRLKALEGMAAGRPVVGTRIGLGGLGIEPGVQALVADSPADFADAVIEVLRDDERARRLGDAGRAHVAEHFGWDRIGARFVETVLELLGETRDQPPARWASSSA